MKICANPRCQKPFAIRVQIGTKFHNLCNRKFCLECSPFKAHNNRDITKPPYDRKGNSYSYVKSFRKNKKLKALEYLGLKCKVCEYNKCPDAMHFHHLNPSEKDFTIASKSAWSFERIKPELDKCVLLCCRCHAEVHAGLVTL